MSRTFLQVLRLAPVRWALFLSALFAFGSLLPAWQVFSAVEHYLALHTALEVFSITVSAMVFALGWNLRRTPRSGPFVWLGIIFLAVALIDFLHTVSYAGMPVFITPSGSEKAINFWLVARTFAVLGLFVLPFLDRTRWSLARVHLSLMMVLAAMTLMVWVILFQSQALPRTFIPGQGITALKIGAEYVLSAAYAMSALLLLVRGFRDGEGALTWLASAAWTMALAELYFTLYIDVSDVFNVLGHVYKLVASVMIYKAVFSSGVREPHAALAHERALLRAMIDSVPDLIAFKDTRGAYLGCNKAFSRCYDVSEASLIGHTDGELFGPGMQQSAEREQRLLMALQGASLGIWDWDIGSGRMSFSPLWAAMLGRRLEDVAQDVSTWEALVHPEDWSAIQATLAPHLRGETESYTAEYRMRHSEGHWVWVQDAGRVLERDEEGKALRAVGLHQDISSRKAMEESLLQLATSDPLTGLWNRRYFTEMANGELGRVRRHGSNAGFLLLDLDHFKRVNDTWGHAAGDEVLRHFAGLVSGHLREVDVFARLGGEEFGVLLPCIDDAAGALRAAERLRDLIASNPAIVCNAPLPFSVSIGVAMLDTEDSGFDMLFTRADEALYEAKRSGRNRAVLARRGAETGCAPEDVQPVSEVAPR